MGIVPGSESILETERYRWLNVSLLLLVCIKLSMDVTGECMSKYPRGNNHKSSFIKHSDIQSVTFFT